MDITDFLPEFQLIRSSDKIFTKDWFIKLAIIFSNLFIIKIICQFMIDNKKLLCTFIYSAYESGYCKLNIGQEEFEKYKKMYLDYISEGKYYPQGEIENSHKEMMDLVNQLGVRNYIYIKHFEVIKTDIEKETGLSFQEALKDRMTLNTAQSCPVNLYRITRVNGAIITGENLVLKISKKLKILKGLERPNLRDIVSGHWDFMLEILEDPEEISRYKDTARNYYFK